MGTSPHRTAIGMDGRKEHERGNSPGGVSKVLGGKSTHMFDACLVFGSELGVIFELVGCFSDGFGFGDDMAFKFVVG